ncbi:MAG: hypothetical protein E7617_00150 [Ruminococcaceae bacterium]|nr:hypothetical protein [Oscillospiraceae bacterium]
MEKIKNKLLGVIRGENFSANAVMALIIGLIIAFNVIVYALTVRFSLYLYSPDVDDYSLSGAMDESFRKAEEDGHGVKVIFCAPLNEAGVPDTSAQEVVAFYRTALEYKTRYPEFIELEFVNIYTKKVYGEDGKETGEFADLSKYQEKNADGSPVPLGEVSVIFVSDVTHKAVVDIGASAFIYDPASNSSDFTAYSGEEFFAAMVNRVLKTDADKTAYFTSYHGEKTDVAFATMLANAGYNISMIDLRKSEIPEDAGLVVISNPVKDFERSANSKVRSEIERLGTYMENGGNLYVALDPYTDKLHVLENFLEDYGIKVSSVEREGKIYRNIVKDSSNAITLDNFTMVCEFADNGEATKIADTVKKYSDSGVILKECAALELSGNARELLVSSAQSSLHAGKDVTDDEGGYCVAAISTYTNSDGQTSNLFVTPGVYLTASDILLAGGYANRSFIHALLEDVYGCDSVIHGCEPIYIHENTTLRNLTMRAATVYTVIIMTVPVVLAAVGAVVYVKRKNK